MIELLFLAAIGAAKAVDKIGDEKARIQDRNKAWAQGNHEYVSRYGRTYYDNTRAFRGTDFDTGHDVVRDLKTRQIIHDYTNDKIDAHELEIQNQKEQLIKKAKSEGVGYYRYSYWKKYWDGHQWRRDDYKGFWEISTGKRFTVGIKDGKFVKWYWHFRLISEYSTAKMWEIYNDEYIEITEDEYKFWGGGTLDGRVNYTEAFPEYFECGRKKYQNYDIRKVMPLYDAEGERKKLNERIEKEKRKEKDWRFHIEQSEAKGN